MTRSDKHALKVNPLISKSLFLERAEVELKSNREMPIRKEKGH
jgi:hypothetical protein